MSLVYKPPKKLISTSLMKLIIHFVNNIAYTRRVFFSMFKLIPSIRVYCLSDDECIFCIKLSTSFHGIFRLYFVERRKQLPALAIFPLYAINSACLYK